MAAIRGMAGTFLHRELDHYTTEKKRAVLVSVVGAYLQVTAKPLHSRQARCQREYCIPTLYSLVSSVCAEHKIC